MKSIKKVNDQGSEHKKEDVFELCIRELLGTNLNKNAIPNIDIKFETRDNKKIVGLWVPRSPNKPVYVKPTDKIKKYLKHEFYLRNGNSTVPLMAEARDDYIKDNFGE